MEKRKKKKGWISSYYRPVMHMILPDIKEEEQYELENVASAKTHEKSSSLPTSKDYAGEKKEKESRPSHSLLNKLLSDIVEEEEPLNIDNSAESHEKLLFSHMSKDYAGGSAESDVKEEEYPEPMPFCFDESDEIGMARMRLGRGQHLCNLPKIVDKKLKDIEESVSPLMIREKLARIRSKPIMITNKDRKYKKPKDIQVTKNEISRNYPSQCFTILSLSFLPVFLFLLYFYFGLSHIDQNDKYTDIFAPDIVELEKEISDHDKTVQVLTEYFQRDIPLLKVVALIGGIIVDKSYTVDIIKKRLYKRNDNDFSSSYPTNFVVLRNLRAEHSTDVINFVRMYQEAYGSRQFIILVVFKIERINDDSTHSTDMNRTINIVKDSFTEANIVSKIIPFKPLDEEILENYIINTAKDIGQTFLQEQINYNKRRLIEDNINCKKAYGC